VRGTPISTWTTTRQGRRSSRVMGGIEARNAVLLRRRISWSSLMTSGAIGEAWHGSWMLEYCPRHLDSPGAH